MSEDSAVGRSPVRPGAALKAMRTRRGWTLAEVSSRTGLPVSTLSKVENDRVTLTYDKLVKISDGMKVDIARLFHDSGQPEEQPNSNGRRSITRAGEGPAIETKNYGHVYPAADLLNKRIVPIIADIRARSLEEFGELIRHPGEEYAFVIEGEVEIHTSLYMPVSLKAGDSIYFDSGMGHAYIAVGKGPCKILSVCTGETAQADSGG